VKMMTFTRQAPFKVQAYYVPEEGDDLPADATIGVYSIHVPEGLSAPKRFKLRLKLDLNGIFEIDEVHLHDSAPGVAEQNGTKDNGGSSAPGVKSSVSFTCSPSGEAELIEKRRENERAMQKQALELQLREDKRNDLESFIYNTRDKISSQYASIVTDEEKAAVPGVLEKAELWLEDHFEDGTLAEFQQKLLELQDIVRPITDRYAASQEGSPLHTAKAELQAVVKEATEILSTRSPVNEKSMEELEAEVRKAKDLESSDPEEYALCTIRIKGCLTELQD